MLSEDEFLRLNTTKRARAMFRPVADVIKDGVIIPNEYIFYPYGEGGNRIIESESELKQLLPLFYEQKLRPNYNSLKKRGSHYREWWELTRPVATWLGARTPRIVSQEFGRSENFAIDRAGEYAVVQGFGWCWKGKPSLQSLYAYLAILNSRVFDDVLSAYCPTVQGRQFVLRKHYVERVPLPKIEDDELRRALADIGKAIASESDFDKREHLSLVRTAFGLTGKAKNDSTNAGKRLERRFRDLASQWLEATGVYSQIEEKVEHPLYRQIVSLGREVVPLLLREMRDNPSFWSEALVEITGADPVSNEATTLDEVADAWVTWGRSHGYDL